jgi:hypothetical protein
MPAYFVDRGLWITFLVCVSVILVVCVGSAALRRRRKLAAERREFAIDAVLLDNEG